MSAKINILGRLRKGQVPLTEVKIPKKHYVIAPMDEVDLLTHFIQQAESLSATVYQAENEQDALDSLHQIIAEDTAILAWDFDQIPLKNLEKSLNENNITLADSCDATIRVGITGVEVALAATGSIVISAGEGKARSVSLLPYVHVAIIREKQIVPHLDAWIEVQSQDKKAFREIGNHIVITGASRTADIGMELVLGAHGPAELHILILP